MIGQTGINCGLKWLLLWIIVGTALGQRVGIGTTNPDPSAALEVVSSDKGILIPKIPISSISSPNPISASPPVGLLIFNPGTAGVLPKGFYWWDGTKWRYLMDSVSTVGVISGDGTVTNPVGLISGSAPGQIIYWDGTSWQLVQLQDVESDPNAWKLTGNSGTSPTTNFIGTVDNAPLVFRTNNIERMRIDSVGLVGIGVSTPTYRLHVGGDAYIADSLRIDGDFRPGGNPGITGQLLVSQGPGNPPQWTTLSTTGDVFGCSGCPTMLGPEVNANGDSIAPCTTPGISWMACAQACAKSTYGGYTDWRMPTLFEIIELSRKVEFSNVCAGYIWTATPVGYKGVEYSGTTSGQWYSIRLSDGHWVYGDASTTVRACRCVR